MAELLDEVNELIGDIPDFPKPGILFKDIMPVLAHPRVFGDVVQWMAADWGEVDKVVGMESRGFIFAAALVTPLQAGFVPARKKGKLPGDVRGVEYALEYGTATLEMQTNALMPGDRVLIVDDLLATGGTAAATVDLVRQLGGVVVGCAFMIELTFLPGRGKLDVPVRTLVKVG